MTDQTISELTGYAATAAELRRIADAIEHLDINQEVPYVNVSFLPSAYKASPEQRIADVDEVAYAVLGRPGQSETHKDGSRYYFARASRAGVNISVQEQISAPDDQPAADRGLAYSREADDPTPVSGGRVEMHTGAVTEAGLVDETDPDPLIPADLRETVHWRTSGLPRMTIACGAQSGPHSADLLKVTCKACLDQVPF